MTEERRETRKVPKAKLLTRPNSKNTHCSVTSFLLKDAAQILGPVPFGMLVPAE